MRSPYMGSLEGMEQADVIRYIEEEFRMEFDFTPEFIVAYMGGDGYSGQAYFLFAHEGEVYEVEADHCSCYGFEGQWSPAYVTRAYLENRLANGSFFPHYSTTEKRWHEKTAEAIHTWIYQ